MITIPTTEKDRAISLQQALERERATAENAPVARLARTLKDGLMEQSVIDAGTTKGREALAEKWAKQAEQARQAERMEAGKEPSHHDFVPPDQPKPGPSMGPGFGPTRGQAFVNWHHAQKAHQQALERAGRDEQDNERGGR